jgi:mRNA-degrading endonuclease YafQ of YafQ-DinJ toxin-antitoxin module
VKHKLLRSTAFVRAARKPIKKNPGLAPDLRGALELLSEDPFHPSLRTHKLKGQLANSWACSASYEIRIVFSFVEFEDQEAVLLETAGTHEEVY